MDKRKYMIDEIEPTIIDDSISEDFEATTIDSNVMEEDYEKTTIVKKTIPSFAWLVCVERRMMGERYDVNQEITSIGRDPSNTIFFPDESISKQHAKIKYFADDDMYKIFDLVSTNGTMVNSEEAEGPVLLKDNDLVQMGEIRFVFKKVDLKSVNKK
ncbi:MAG: FHA domain-containing protein [Caldisericia bacterium]|nr:FHA domain-containing protein [Caldisericia bacterium]MDD4614503.1 FHA domain-containing protein [Caldisericia bacterium]